MPEKRGTPRKRVVLLGASNLSRGLSTILGLFQQGFGGEPLEVLAALGWGRSYGTGSWVLGRSLPGIPQCGLWKSLGTRPELPTSALVTDVGNDLAYGVPPEQIAEWVEWVLKQLVAAKAKSVLVLPPVEEVASLSLWRFSLTRLLYFPRHQVNRDGAVQGLRRLDGLLREVAEDLGVQFMENREEWYGWDPIHVARRHQWQAWSAILEPFFESPLHPSSILTLTQRWRVFWSQPEVQWLFGLEIRRSPDPDLWREGSSLELY